jgi:sugar lactone lactonase YvrE
MLRPRCELVTAERFGIGECPIWDAKGRRLLWTSINDGDIHALSLYTGERRKWHFNSTVGAFGLCRSDRLVVALRDQVVVFDPSSGKRTTLATIKQPVAQARLNDGKVGPDGSFWVGGMDERPVKEAIAKLYRITAEGGVAEIADGLKVSNGLAWSPDGRIMYHSDSQGSWIDRWDFDPATGAATNRRRFLDLDEATGRPDGAAVDVEGCYWSAGVSASRVNRFALDGHLIEAFELPSLRPTMPCFGGDDMKTVFVTSLTNNVPPAMLAAHPLCGKTLSFRSAVAGTAPYRFAT